MMEEVESSTRRDFLGTFLQEDNNDQTLISLAERLLFPMDNADDSGAENSDWIVSDDGEDGYFDVKEMLRDTEVGEGRILYHTEAEEDDDEGCTSMLESFDQPPPLPPPLLLHEAVCGEDGSGGEREALVKAIEFCKAPGLLDATNSQGQSCCCRCWTSVCSLSSKRSVVWRHCVHVDQPSTVSLFSSGYTALMCAAEKGDNRSAQLLLEAGASVNSRGENAASALHLAALSGWLDCVQLLISHGHTVDCTDEQGWPPILYAHFKDHEECVLALLKAKPQQVSGWDGVENVRKPLLYVYTDHL